MITFPPFAKVLVLDADEQSREKTIEIFISSYFDAIAVANLAEASHAYQEHKPTIITLQLKDFASNDELISFVEKIRGNNPPSYAPIPLIIGQASNGYAEIWGIENARLVYLNAANMETMSVVEYVSRTFKKREYHEFWRDDVLGMDFDGQVLLRNLLRTKQRDWVLIRLDYSYGATHYSREGLKHFKEWRKQLVGEVIAIYGTKQDTFIDTYVPDYIISFAENYGELMDNLVKRFNHEFTLTGFEPVGDYMKIYVSVCDMRLHSVKDFSEIWEVIRADFRARKGMV